MGLYRETDEIIKIDKMLMLNYKKLGLQDDETIILLLTYTLLKTGNTFINPSDLALFSNFTVTKIDVLYTNLISKGFIETVVEENGKVKTSLTPLYKKLQEIFVSDYQKQEKKESKESKDDIYALFEGFFGRPLSPLEYDIINGWFEKKYSIQDIKNALEICKQSPNHSIRYIDSILFEEHKKRELGEQEYQSRLQETIELSKIDWLNK